MKNKKFLIIAAVLVALVVVLILAKDNIKINSGSKTEGLNTTQSEIRTIEQKIYASGTIGPARKVEIKSQISGIVEEIYVGTGQKIRKGDKVAKVTLVPDPQSLTSAESSLRISKINLEEARKEFERQQKLYEGKIISEVDYNASMATYKIRQEEVKSAQATVQLLKDGISQKANQTSNIIYSTTDGTVLGIYAKEGASVIGRSSFQEGSPIVVVADMNKLIFRGEISESDVGKLEIDMNLSLTIGAIEDKKFNARLGYIAPEGEADANGGAVKFEVQALVQQKEGYIIRSGYSANAEIVLARADSVLSIQERDVTFRNDSAFVEVLNGNKTEERNIELGVSDGIYTEVLSGLSKEDKFKSNERLGNEVNISF